MEQIKVLLVDDQRLFVESLRTVIETRAADIEVIGVAYNGVEAIDSVAKERPDIVLMDVRMPEMNGVESTRLIKEKYPETKVLMVTTFDDDQYVIEALRFGAVGYLLKDMPPLELISAIRAVYEGGVLISPAVAAKLVEKLANPVKPEKETPDQQGPDTDICAGLNELNGREKKIIQLMAQGYDNKEIAKELYVAEQTVKNYVSIIYSKLGVRDRVQVSRLVIESGLDKQK
jgi:Response regulator containing a CheY-like receiver domain and an HTH DNA-binding domain